MKDFGTVRRFLGIKLAYAKDGSVRMSQKEYAKRVLKKLKKMVLIYQIIANVRKLLLGYRWN